MNRKELKSFFSESFLSRLNEQEGEKEAGVDTPDTPMSVRDSDTRARPAKDSVDDQIDALILRYEMGSIREKSNVNESLKNLDLKFLFEQEEPEGDAPEEGDLPPDEPPAEEPAEDIEPAGSDDMQVTEPADSQNIPNLDIDKFAMRIVRLVNNYENLLRVEEAVINRAKTFLDENYGEVFVDEFMNSLSQKYGIELEEFNDVPDISDEQFAVGAFAGGTGGLGGGGA